MIKWLQAFIIAWQFLTRIPIPIRVPYEVETVSRSAAFFPLIGSGIGVCLYVFEYLLPSEAEPVNSVLILLLWTILTGALHLDGLMDSADGLGSHRSRERMLEIMKDSRIGAMGALAGMFILALKGTSLWWLMSYSDANKTGNTVLFFILLSVPAVSRWFITFAIVRFPYTGGMNGMGSYFQKCGWTELYAASGLVLLPFLFVSSAQWLLLPAGQFMIGICAAVYVRRKLGGLTGDSYGALNELLETAGLVLSVYIALEAGR